MYICLDCKNSFEEDDIISQTQTLTILDGVPYIEEFTCCPYCGESDFVTANECAECGEIFSSELDGTEDVCTGCVNECLQEVSKHLDKIFDEYKDESRIAIIAEIYSNIDQYFENRLQKEDLVAKERKGCVERL